MSARSVYKLFALVALLALLSQPLATTAALPAPAGLRKPAGAPAVPEFTATAT